MVSPPRAPAAPAAPSCRWSPARKLDDDSRPGPSERRRGEHQRDDRDARVGGEKQEQRPCARMRLIPRHGCEPTAVCVHVDADAQWPCTWTCACTRRSAPTNAPRRVSNAEPDQQQARDASSLLPNSCISSRPKKSAKQPKQRPTPSRGRDRTRRSPAAVRAQTSARRAPARRMAPSDPARACEASPRLTAARRAPASRRHGTSPAPATAQLRRARTAYPLRASAAIASMPSPVRADTRIIAGLGITSDRFSSIARDADVRQRAAADRSSSAAPGPPCGTSSGT